MAATSGDCCFKMKLTIRVGLTSLGVRDLNTADDQLVALGCVIHDHGEDDGNNVWRIRPHCLPQVSMEPGALFETAIHNT